MDNAWRAWLLSRVRRIAVFLVALVVALLAPLLGALGERQARAGADVDVDRRAQALAVFRQAEADDDALELRRALAEYEEALRLDPATSKAMRAEERAKSLRARSEGDFAPLIALERVRRSPELSSDGAAIDSLVRSAAEFPPGLVRVEAWSLAAEAYASRLGRPEDAIPLWRRVTRDPASDSITVGSALDSLVRLELARGDFAAAEDDARTLGAGPQTMSMVRRVVRRRTIHRGSIVAIAATLILALVAIARAEGRRATLRRSVSPVALGFAAYVAIAGGALASAYEDGNAKPFLLFGIALGLLLLLSRAWGMVGSETRRARGARAVLCAASVLGTAFLVLEAVDVGYLEGLGL
jgi:tetratricopeptide (TPR) repeat protein